MAHSMENEDDEDKEEVVFGRRKGTTRLTSQANKPTSKARDFEGAT